MGKVININGKSHLTDGYLLNGNVGGVVPVTEKIDMESVLSFQIPLTMASPYCAVWIHILEYIVGIVHLINHDSSGMGIIKGR